MKRIFLFLLICCIATTAFGQSDTVRLKQIGKSPAVITDRPPQGVYFQLGGAGLLFSVVYDRRFQKRVDGLGFAVGAGYYGGSGASVFTIPVSLNYLIGKRSHFVEIAAGGTYASATVTDFFDTQSESGIFIHTNLGYRYQPSNGGFFFRGGFSPLFYQGEAVVSFYLSFGYNF